MKKAFLFSTLLPLILLFAPSALAIELRLFWEDVESEDGYAVERQLDSEGWIEIGRTSADAVEFTDAAPVAGKKHSYRVRAFNADGSSDPSNEAAVFFFETWPVILSGGAALGYDQSVIVTSLEKPANATAAALHLRVFDGDLADEGEIFINGNGPVTLFGTRDNALDETEGDRIIDTPVEWWKDGENRLVFTLNPDRGYNVLSARVVFTVPVQLVAPAGLKIEAR